jgi:hypothetical protein
MAKGTRGASVRCLGLAMEYISSLGQAMRGGIKHILLI